jgi:hypothetical protein
MRGLIVLDWIRDLITGSLRIEIQLKEGFIPCFRDSRDRNGMIVPGKELPQTQNFTVTLEFHCFLIFLQKLLLNAHQPELLSIFDKVMQRAE